MAELAAKSAASRMLLVVPVVLIILVSCRAEKEPLMSPDSESPDDPVDMFFYDHHDPMDQIAMETISEPVYILPFHNTTHESNESAPYDHKHHEADADLTNNTFENFNRPKIIHTNTSIASEYPVMGNDSGRHTITHTPNIKDETYLDTDDNSNIYTFLENSMTVPKGLQDSTTKALDLKAMASEQSVLHLPSTLSLADSEGETLFKNVSGDPLITVAPIGQSNSPEQYLQTASLHSTQLHSNSTTQQYEEDLKDSLHEKRQVSAVSPEPKYFPGTAHLPPIPHPGNYYSELHGHRPFLLPDNIYGPPKRPEPSYPLWRPRPRPNGRKRGVPKRGRYRVRAQKNKEKNNVPESKPPIEVGYDVTNLAPHTEIFPVHASNVSNDYGIKLMQEKVHDSHNLQTSQDFIGNVEVKYNTPFEVHQKFPSPKIINDIQVPSLPEDIISLEDPNERNIFSSSVSPLPHPTVPSNIKPEDDIPGTTYQPIRYSTDDYRHRVYIPDNNNVSETVTRTPTSNLIGIVDKVPTDSEYAYVMDDSPQSSLVDVYDLQENPDDEIFKFEESEQDSIATLLADRLPRPQGTSSTLLNINTDLYEGLRLPYHSVVNQSTEIPNNNNTIPDILETENHSLFNKSISTSQIENTTNGLQTVTQNDLVNTSREFNRNNISEVSDERQYFSSENTNDTTGNTTFTDTQTLVENVNIPLQKGPTPNGNFNPLPQGQNFPQYEELPNYYDPFLFEYLDTLQRAQAQGYPLPNYDYDYDYDYQSGLPVDPALLPPVSFGQDRIPLNFPQGQNLNFVNTPQEQSSLLSALLRGQGPISEISLAQESETPLDVSQGGTGTIPPIQQGPTGRPLSIPRDEGSIPESFLDQSGIPPTSVRGQNRNPLRLPIDQIRIPVRNQQGQGLLPFPYGQNRFPFQFPQKLNIPSQPLYPDDIEFPFPPQEEGNKTVNISDNTGGLPTNIPLSSNGIPFGFLPNLNGIANILPQPDTFTSGFQGGPSNSLITSVRPSISSPSNNILQDVSPSVPTSFSLLTTPRIRFTEDEDTAIDIESQSYSETTNSTPIQSTLAVTSPSGVPESLVTETIQASTPSLQTNVNISQQSILSEFTTTDSTILLESIPSINSVKPEVLYLNSNDSRKSDDISLDSEVRFETDISAPINKSEIDIAFPPAPIKNETPVVLVDTEPKPIPPVVLVDKNHNILNINLARPSGRNVMNTDINNLLDATNSNQRITGKGSDGVDLENRKLISQSLHNLGQEKLKVQTKNPIFLDRPDILSTDTSSSRAKDQVVSQTEPSVKEMIDASIIQGENKTAHTEEPETLKHLKDLFGFPNGTRTLASDTTMSPSSGSRLAIGSGLIIDDEILQNLQTMIHSNASKSSISTTGIFKAIEEAIKNSTLSNSTFSESHSSTISTKVHPNEKPPPVSKSNMNALKTLMAIKASDESDIPTIIRNFVAAQRNFRKNSTFNSTENHDETGEQHNITSLQEMIKTLDKPGDDGVPLPKANQHPVTNPIVKNSTDEEGEFLILISNESTIYPEDGEFIVIIPLPEWSHYHRGVFTPVKRTARQNDADFNEYLESIEDYEEVFDISSDGKIQSTSRQGIPNIDFENYNDRFQNLENVNLSLLDNGSNISERNNSSAILSEYESPPEEIIRRWYEPHTGGIRLGDFDEETLPRKVEYDITGANWINSRDLYENLINNVSAARDQQEKLSSQASLLPEDNQGLKGSQIFYPPSNYRNFLGEGSNFSNSENQSSQVPNQINPQQFGYFYQLQYPQDLYGSSKEIEEYRSMSTSVSAVPEYGERLNQTLDEYTLLSNISVNDIITAEQITTSFENSNNFSFLGDGALRTNSDVLTQSIPLSENIEYSELNDELYDYASEYQSDTQGYNGLIDMDYSPEENFETRFNDQYKAEGVPLEVSLGPNIVLSGISNTSEINENHRIVNSENVPNHESTLQKIDSLAHDLNTPQAVTSQLNNSYPNDKDITEVESIDKSKIQLDTSSNAEGTYIPELIQTQQETLQFSRSSFPTGDSGYVKEESLEIVVTETPVIYTAPSLLPEIQLSTDVNNNVTKTNVSGGTTDQLPESRKSGNVSIRSELLFNNSTSETKQVISGERTSMHSNSGEVETISSDIEQKTIGNKSFNERILEDFNGITEFKATDTNLISDTQDSKLIENSETLVNVDSSDHSFTPVTVLSIPAFVSSDADIPTDVMEGTSSDIDDESDQNLTSAMVLPIPGFVSPVADIPSDALVSPTPNMFPNQFSENQTQASIFEKELGDDVLNRSGLVPLIPTTVTTSNDNLIKAISSSPGDNDSATSIVLEERITPNSISSSQLPTEIIGIEVVNNQRIANEVLGLMNKELTNEVAFDISNTTNNSSRVDASHIAGMTDKDPNIFSVSSTSLPMLSSQSTQANIILNNNTNGSVINEPLPVEVRIVTIDVGIVPKDSLSIDDDADNSTHDDIKDKANKDIAVPENPKANNNILETDVAINDRDGKSEQVIGGDQANINSPSSTLLDIPDIIDVSGLTVDFQLPGIQVVDITPLAKPFTQNSNKESQLSENLSFGNSDATPSSVGNGVLLLEDQFQENDEENVNLLPGRLDDQNPSINTGIDLSILTIESKESNNGSDDPVSITGSLSSHQNTNGISSDTNAPYADFYIPPPGQEPISDEDNQFKKGIPEQSDPVTGSKLNQQIDEIIFGNLDPQQLGNIKFDTIDASTLQQQGKSDLNTQFQDDSSVASDTFNSNEPIILLESPVELASIEDPKENTNILLPLAPHVVTSSIALGGDDVQYLDYIDINEDVDSDYSFPDPKPNVGTSGGNSQFLANVNIPGRVIPKPGRPIGTPNLPPIILGSSNLKNGRPQPPQSLNPSPTQGRVIETTTTTVYLAAPTPQNQRFQTSVLQNSQKTPTHFPANTPNSLNIKANLGVSQLRDQKDKWVWRGANGLPLRYLPGTSSSSSTGNLRMQENTNTPYRKKVQNSRGLTQISGNNKERWIWEDVNRRGILAGRSIPVSDGLTRWLQDDYPLSPTVVSYLYQKLDALTEEYITNEAGKSSTTVIPRRTEAPVTAKQSYYW